MDNKPHIFILGRPLSLVLIVAYKTVWGLVEAALGTGVLVVVATWQHVGRNAWVHALVQKELSEDPHDALISWFLAHDSTSSRHILVQIGIVLLVLGVLKVVLAVGVWRRSWLMRDIFMILLTIGAVIGLAALGRHFSALRLTTLVLDLLVLYYLWRVLPKYLHHEVQVNKT